MLNNMFAIRKTYLFIWQTILDKIITLTQFTGSYSDYDVQTSIGFDIIFFIIFPFFFSTF